MNEILSILIMLLCGIMIRQSLIYAGQMWAKSFAQTVSFFILPIITFIITKTIYGNIALSLGMIGALSIVRFRHPVKSALELIIYFDLITIGIAASVKNEYAIILGILTAVILVLLKLINNYRIKSNKSGFYNISFTEGIEFNQLEVVSSLKVEIIEENENLKSIVFDQENNEYLYRMAFDNKETLNLFKKNIENLEMIKKIDVNYI